LAENVQLGLRVPPGFEVTEFADSRLANDIFTMTLDPRGRVVVSGRGYIRILVDTDKDGRADRVINFADGPKDGAHGLLWEGDALYFTGDGGLRRYRDAEGDGRADGPSELIRALKTGGEHDAHALRRGPDGWLYLLCGNMTGIDRRFAQAPTSPIRDPVAGCVLRFSPDFKISEIVADGFRNAYGMDFNPDGELFAFDSDNERCVSLPWYEFTRFYHILRGGHYGWRAPQRGQTWRSPPYLPDVVAPLAYLGRGSPTGVACYRHVQFPERYRGGMFLLDWTFGRVYFVALERSGSTYTARKEVFLESVGDNGFAPTAVVVHPETGDLYLSIGGRGTRGAVYRVRYPTGLRSAGSAELAKLRAGSPVRDWPPAAKHELVEKAAGGEAHARLQSLAAMRRYQQRFDSAQVQAAIRSNWGHPDRYVRKAATDLIASLEDGERLALSQHARTPLEQTTYGLGSYLAKPADVLARVLLLLPLKDADVEARLAGVRLIQLALGDLTAPQAMGTVWEGYSPGRPPLSVKGFHKDLLAQTAAVLRAAFPAGQADLDREISRTLAMLEDDNPIALTKIADRLTDSSDPVEDVHYLIVLARLRGPRPSGLTKRTSTALLALDRKLTARRRNRDSNWPLRIAELHAELARKDSGLNAALLASADFGRPDHALFARCPRFDRQRAAEVFLARGANEEEYPWNPPLVELIGSLPPERSVPVLRRLWSKGGLEEAILSVLARNPQTVDRDKFLDGLGSPQLVTVRQCLEALDTIPPVKEPGQVWAFIRALRRLPEGREAEPLRAQLGNHLQWLTGQKLGNDKQAWADWFSTVYPALAGRLSGSDGVDVNGWQQRLTKLDWPAGDANRGQDVFGKASCAACHSGSQAMGPDLHGVAGRFSRADLFTAIVQPSRDISPRYRTTLVATADGKVYQGLIVYEAVDSLILQTGPATTVRVVNNQIVSRRFTETSLMPAGLLDKLSDREIADLYAFLKSLGSAPAARRQ
jgi:putative membrane-bound dehydrogenase-like protein